MSATDRSVGGGAWLRRASLFAELQDLKRQRPAHLGDSIPNALFRRAWRRLCGGAPAREVAFATAAEALTNILFPGCDERFFAAAGLDESATLELLRSAVDASAGETLAPELRGELDAALVALAARYHGGSSVAEAASVQPAFVDVLCRQPRAGATRPGVPRLVLAPPEMHGEHCLLTAVYAVLASRAYDADPGEAFLCALAHHLHNALLPDCGFAGEILLGDRLAGVIARGRALALEQLAEPLRAQTATALRHHETLATPEGYAVSAGDVLDRVLDVKWRTRAAAVTDADVLGDLDLVHAGPLKDFQMDLLTQTALWSAR